MSSLSAIWVVLSAWLSLPLLSDVSSFLASRRGAGRALSTNRPRYLLLVPAHDEEAVIGACLRSISLQQYSNFRTVVVADNCSDSTADIVRRAGFDCLERNDAVNRGKPHALSWAFRQIDLSAFDAVVIVDADCVIEPDFLTELSHAGAGPTVAVQPFNGVANPEENAVTRMAAILSEALHGIAFRVKASGGRNVPLSAGMCLGTDLLKEGGWKAFSLGEDWETYALLTAAGTRIFGAPAARLRALEAASLKEGESQRRRWMVGKLWVFSTYALPILRSRRIDSGKKLDAIAELSQPGPAVHLGIVGIGLIVLLSVRPDGYSLAATLLLASLARQIIYTVAAVFRQDDPGKALAAFAFLPVYVVWRLAIAVKHVFGRWNGVWVRTSRGSVATPPNNG